MRAGVFERAAEREAVTAFLPAKVVAQHGNREVVLRAASIGVNVRQEVAAGGISIKIVLVRPLRVIGIGIADIGDRGAPDQAVCLVVADHPVPPDHPRVARVQVREGLRIAREFRRSVHRIDIVVGDAAKEVVILEGVYIESADVVLFDIGFGSIEAESGRIQQVARVTAKVVRRGVALPISTFAVQK